jgi:hypothetical protein
MPHISNLRDADDRYLISLALVGLVVIVYRRNSRERQIIQFIPRPDAATPNGFPDNRFPL